MQTMQDSQGFLSVPIYMEIDSQIQIYIDTQTQIPETSDNISVNCCHPSTKSIAKEDLNFHLLHRTEGALVPFLRSEGNVRMKPWRWIVPKLTARCCEPVTSSSPPQSQLLWTRPRELLSCSTIAGGCPLRFTPLFLFHQCRGRGGGEGTKWMD